MGCSDDTQLQSPLQEPTRAIVNAQGDLLVNERINEHFSAGSANSKIHGISMEDIDLDSVFVSIEGSVYRYILRVKPSPGDLTFRNYLIQYDNGRVSDVMIHFIPNPEWRKDTPRTAKGDLDWSTFSGSIIITNLISNVSNTVEIVNGETPEQSTSGGRVDDLVCGMVLYEITTDWYTNNNYTDTQTSYEWQYGCEYTEPSAAALNIPSGVGGSTSYVVSVEESCSGCSNSAPIMTYDQNQDPIAMPCQGDPLAQMTIMTNNQGVNSNRSGCVRIGSACPSDATKQLHAGIDLQASTGTPIYPVKVGTVWGKGFDADGWGHWIGIRNGDYHYLYAHLDEASQLNFGDYVGKLSTIVGVAGTTGNPDVPHLHLEVRKKTGRQSYNNMTQLDPEEHLTTKFNQAGQVSSDC